MTDRWTPEVVRVAASLVFDQENAVQHFDALCHGAAPDSEAWIVQQVLEHSGVADEIDRLRAENARYRSALHSISDEERLSGSYMRHIAQIALAEKEAR